jgi:thiol-disulfide isomerase/thioredoxin
MKKYIGLFILFTISATTPSIGQSYHSLVHNARTKYLSMETICAVVHLTSEKENVISSSTKLLYADNRDKPWRLIVLPEYHRYIFYDGNQTYTFLEEEKLFYIDKDSASVLRLNSYLDNISGIVLSRDTISANTNDTTTREKTVDIGKGIDQIIITSDDIPDYGISDFVFRMDINKTSFTPLRATTTYSFLGGLVSEKAELDTVYQSTSETDLMLKKIHEMISTYQFRTNEERELPPEKSFNYQQILDKLTFIHQPPANSKYHFVDFYYVNCGPCLKALPYIKALANEQKPENLSIVAVSPYDSKEKIENYAVKNQISYAEAMIDKDFVNDAIGHIGYPFFVLFDSDGNILLKNTGFDPSFFDKVREIINK